MLLFFLHIAHHLSHKTRNEYKAVALLLSLYSLLRYVRYLMHSMQKSRGARFCAICKKENLRSKSDCSFKETATYSRSILVIPLTLVSLTALCNRGKSCKSRAEGIYSLCRDAADLSREKIAKQSSAS